MFDCTMEYLYSYLHIDQNVIATVTVIDIVIVTITVYILENYIFYPLYEYVNNMLILYIII